MGSEKKSPPSAATLGGGRTLKRVSPNERTTEYLTKYFEHQQLTPGELVAWALTSRNLTERSRAKIIVCCAR